MTATPGSTTAPLLRARGGVGRGGRDERGAVFVPMTGLVVVLFGLSVLLADQLGVPDRDAGSLAAAAATRGAAVLSESVTGLDPAEARARAGQLGTGRACRAARASAAPVARVTTCSIVGTDLVVVVVTTEPPTSTARATASLIGDTPS